MYRAKPKMKRSLQKKWNERLNTIHLDKIFNVKSRVDVSNPSQFGHFPARSKREQLLEGMLSAQSIDRYTEIERANRLLLERLTDIMRPKKVSSLSSCQQKSLNRSLRKREMVKIMDENKAFLRRLQAKKSHYNVGQWNEEHKNRTRMLHHMGEYPYQFNATSKAPLKLPTVSNRESELSDHKESMLKRKAAANSSYRSEAELRGSGTEKAAVQKAKSAR